MQRQTSRGTALLPVLPCLLQSRYSLTGTVLWVECCLNGPNSAKPGKEQSRASFLCQQLPIHLCKPNYQFLPVPSAKLSLCPSGTDRTHTWFSISSEKPLKGSNATGTLSLGLDCCEKVTRQPSRKNRSSLLRWGAGRCLWSYC